MFMRALLEAERLRIRSEEPPRCFCCGSTPADVELFMFNQLLREEWIACETCGRTRITPDRLELKCEHVAWPRTVGLPRLPIREALLSLSGTSAVSGKP